MESKQKLVSNPSFESQIRENNNKQKCMDVMHRYQAYQKLQDREAKAKSILEPGRNTGESINGQAQSLRRSGSTLGRPGEFIVVSSRTGKS